MISALQLTRKGVKGQNVLGVLTTEVAKAEVGSAKASIPDPWTLQTTLAGWRKVWKGGLG